MKCVLIVINGKEYTEEEFQEAKSAIINAWNKIIKTVSDVIQKVWRALTDVIKNIIDNAPVGYKRIFNSGKLQYYESISADKSNNWRKAHGLPLIRQL